MDEESEWDGLSGENAMDDVGKYLSFSEEESDVRVEIKNDDLLSMTAVKSESVCLDFEGFECSSDPNAFEIDDEPQNDETQRKIDNSVSSILEKSSTSELDSNVRETTPSTKQKRKRGRRAKNVDGKEDEVTSAFDEASTSERLESEEVLDDISESAFDDSCLNNVESVETSSKSSKYSIPVRNSTHSDNPIPKLRVTIAKLTTDKSSDEKEDEIPLKRPRRKVNHFGESSTSTASTSESELEMGHRILKQLISFPASSPFLDRPDLTAHGMNNYYVVVKKPMWLKSVLERYNEDKYPSITELIADIRHVLENCYLYWGAGDPHTKKATRVEELLEKKLAALPSHVRELCSLKATHGEDPPQSGENKTDDNNQQDEVERPKKSAFVSRLLQRVMNSSETDSIASENSFVENVAIEVEEWEKSFLYKGNVEDKIASMWELPQIGQFLNLTLNILNIGQISQYEVERMLLIPQASTVLARVMTSMLVPPFCRVRLEDGPPMPYEFWTNRLKKKVALWYRSYRGTGGALVEVFEAIGIEPEFWLVMSETNPLETMEFHELEFIQRVWILKSLCDYLLHNHKSVQETLNNIESEDLRESCLGRDKQGFFYHYFPEFSEVRIYKRDRVPDKRWNDFDNGVEEMIYFAAVDSSDENKAQDDRLPRTAKKPPRSWLPSPKSFKMVAKCVEDVRRLKDEVGQSSPSLKQKLLALLADVEPIETKIENSIVYLRNKMHKEWLDFTNRPVDYVDPGTAHWSRKELRDSAATKHDDSAAAKQDSAADNVDSSLLTVDRRERRSTSQKYVFDELGPDEVEGEDYEPVEEEDSEEEWVASPKKAKKQRPVSQRKLQTLPSSSKTPDGNLVTVKDEPSSNKVQLDSIQPKSVTTRPTPPPPAIPLRHNNMINTVNIKKESDDVKNVKIKQEGLGEVIDLLSDDEDDVVPVVEDVKPVIKTIECFLKSPVEISQQAAGLPQPPPTLQQPPFHQQLLPQPPLQQMAPTINAPPPFTAVKQEPGTVAMSFATDNSTINAPSPFTTVKQEPGTGAMFNSAPPLLQQQQQSPQMLRGFPSPRGRTMMTSPRMMPSSPRMMTSPRMMSSSPRMMTSPRMMPSSPRMMTSPRIMPSSPRMMTSPRSMPSSPRMMTSPRSMPSSPRMMTSPKCQQNRSPMLQRTGSTPMGRGSPQNMRQRFPPTTPPRQQNVQARRNLNFNSPGRQQNTNPTSAPANPPRERLHIINPGGVVGRKTEIFEGKLVVDMTDDGNYGYFVVLIDGGRVKVPQKQINELRSKCNGLLPDKVGIPMVISGS